MANPPVFWPGEFYGQRSLAGSSPWSCKESDSIEQLTHTRALSLSAGATVGWRLPAMLETWVRSLGWEDPLEKEMGTHSSTLAWRIPWTEKPGRLQSMGSQRVRHD